MSALTTSHEAYTLNIEAFIILIEHSFVNILILEFQKILRG